VTEQVHAFHTADINGDGELDLGEFKQVGTPFLAIILKMVIFPRQARDKHTEKLRKKSGVFLQILGTLGMSIPKKQFAAYADAFFSDLDVDGSRTLDLGKITASLFLRLTV
jgi:hypothetical protein